MTTAPHPTKLPSHPSPWVTLAFAYVYVAWGATYLGIHFALESMPPFLLTSCRFILAGSLLMGLLWIFHSKDFHWGNLLEWRDAGVVGSMLLIGGNGSMVWAQQYVPSSIAALIFGSTPLCIILMEWLRPNGTAPSVRTCVGLVFGFAGLCILIQPSAETPDNRMETLGKLALLFAACSWSAGAIYSRHVHAKGSPLLPMARQMIVAGLALLVISWLHHDWDTFSFGKVTLTSWLGFTYLVVFGSLIGFTAYVWLMRVSTPAHVSTISYVNLVVAVLLGWTIGREPMTLRILIGAGVIVCSVVLVLKKKSARATVNTTPTEG
ncbi:MAG: EamA family transporter [Methylacidiphilales bacterium]|nr:EamA family transporter [Candidatus Methylacidiphilales bacterium]